MRKEISLVMGWKWVINANESVTVFSPGGSQATGNVDQQHIAYEILNLPDYPNDLNAMHQAEKVLTFKQAEEYSSLLLAIQVRDAGENCPAMRCSANAHQKSEAFLKTVKPELFPPQPAN